MSFDKYKLKTNTFIVRKDWLRLSRPLPGLGKSFILSELFKTHY